MSNEGLGKQGKFGKSRHPLDEGKIMARGLQGTLRPLRIGA